MEKDEQINKLTMALEIIRDKLNKIGAEFDPYVAGIQLVLDRVSNGHGKKEQENKR